MFNQGLRIAVIGGGYSGAMTAVHLLRQRIAGLKVTIIEPRQELGKGLAYSTSCPEHLLNVPAFGMSALPDEPDHFLNWARNRDNTVSRESFVPRKTFGEYLLTLISAELSKAEQMNTTVEHVHSRVIDIKKSDQAFRLILTDGESVEADFVVLAIGNLSGKRPAWLNGIGMDCPGYIHDPWYPGAIENIAADEDLLIVGTGLTAVDKIIELKRNGHTGRIFALSRHGLFPRLHFEKCQGMVQPLASSSSSALGGLTILRQQIADIAPSPDGDTWRRVIDGLRSTTQKWWQSISLREQRRFLSHLITYWDVHRHRMAPEIGQKVESTRNSGQLETLAGRILSIVEQNGQLNVTVRERGKADPISFKVSRVINCTGPQSSLKHVDSPLLANLVYQGLVAPHRLGTGIAARADGQVLDKEGNEVSGLFAIGPLLKAELLESVAVPELRQQAFDLAAKIGHLAKARKESALKLS